MAQTPNGHNNSREVMVNGQCTGVNWCKFNAHELKTTKSSKMYAGAGCVNRIWSFRWAWGGGSKREMVCVCVNTVSYKLSSSTTTATSTIIIIIIIEFWWNYAWCRFRHEIVECTIVGTHLTMSRTKIQCTKAHSLVRRTHRRMRALSSKWKKTQIQRTVEAHTHTQT